MKSEKSISKDALIEPLAEEPSDFGASGILSQSAPPHHTSPPPAASTGSIESAGASAHVFLLRRIKIEGDMRPDRGESELCCDANDIKPLGHARLFGNAGSEAGHRRLSRSSFSNTTSSRPEGLWVRLESLNDSEPTHPRDGGGTRE